MENPIHFIFFTAAINLWRTQPACSQSSTCVTKLENALATTICRDNRYIFPTTFDVSQLHPNISSLEVTGDSHVVTDSYVPFPARESLSDVTLRNFNQLPTDSAFPLSGLLTNVRYSIQKLNLYEVKLGSLASGDFNGFNRLTDLVLNSVYLSSVSLSAFTGIGALSQDAPNVEYPGILKTLLISNNTHLTSLDWSFLLPIASGLQVINISNNGFRSDGLTRSIPFFLNSTTGIEISSKNLRNLPRDVFATFVANESLRLQLFSPAQDVGFCEGSPDCSCCDMFDFYQWLGRNSQATAYVRCGSGSFLADHAISKAVLLGKPSLYKQCEMLLARFCYASNNPSESSTAARSSPGSGISAPILYSSAGSSPSAAPVPLDEEDPPIIMTCQKGKLVFSNNQFNETDALTAILTVDNTVRCRNIMHKSHEWLQDNIDRLNEKFVSSAATSAATLALPDSTVATTETSSTSTATTTVSTTASSTTSSTSDTAPSSSTTPETTTATEPATSSTAATLEDSTTSPVTESTTTVTPAPTRAHPIANFSDRPKPTVLIPRIPRKPTTTGATKSPRGKRQVLTDAPSTIVTCRKGSLTLSDDKPELSEATKLTLTTTGSALCRSLYFNFLNFVNRLK